MRPLPYTVEANELLTFAIATMETHKVRHLPVLDQGRLIGVISDRDTRLGLILKTRLANCSPLIVREICTLDPYIVDPDEDVAVVARNMADKRIGSALIARDQKVLGIFTTTDACGWFGACLEGSATED